MRSVGLVVWSVCGVGIALAALGWVLVFASGHIPDSMHGDHGIDPIIALAFVTLSAVASLVVSRQPGNVVGWLMWSLAITALVTSNGIGYGYVVYALEARARGLPGAGLPAVTWIAWLTNPLNTLGFVEFGVLFLVFPSGRTRSRFSSLALRLVILDAALVALDEAFRPGPISYFPAVDNPFGMGWLAPVAGAANSLGGALIAAAMLAGAVSLVVRFRGARGTERQQIKWIAFAVTLVAVYLTLMELVTAVWQLDPDSYPVAFRLQASGWALAVLSVPLAMGIAIMRYRLYAIDRIINSTLVYGVLSVLLVVLYWTCVVVLQQALRPLTQGSDLAIVCSTLAVAALFQPLRQAIQHAVDRRFYRRRYDAVQTLETFATRLRDELDLQMLENELIGVVQQTMQPANASLWLKQPR